MQLLEQRILASGKVLPGDVLKVDSFLNHQLDTELLDEIGREIARLFEGGDVTKVLTAETGGIAIACFTARYLHCPAVYAKKAKPSNLAADVWSAEVHSYTHNNDYVMSVSKEYIGKDDTVLLVDDFLANGCALRGMLEICRKAGAKVAGAGIAVEKGYQDGGNELRREGLRIESMAKIASMDPEDGIRFC